MRQPGAIASLDASGNDGDSDCGDNRDEVDVSQDGNLGEGGRDRENQENDSRHGREGDGANIVVIESAQRNTASQRVRSDNHDKLSNQCGTKHFVSESAEEQSSSISIVGRSGEGQFDLANDVTREDAYESKSNGEEDAGEHAQGVVSRGQTQRTQRNSFDNGDDGEALPAKTMEVSIAGGGNLLDSIIFKLLAGFSKQGFVAHVSSVGQVSVKLSGRFGGSRIASRDVILERTRRRSCSTVVGHSEAVYSVTTE